jgi:putative ABC transport system substrate-binding protein
MRRREFIKAIAGLTAASPLAAHAQQGAKVPRVGFMGNSTPALEANLLEPFRLGLRERGYQEGRNIIIEYRWAEGRYERFPALVTELLAAKVDVIVTAGTPASLAVKKATFGGATGNDGRWRSGQYRHCLKPRAAGRQYHRFECDRTRS